ncbi:MAG: HlyD family efflux transporter periplasmic adaptor subunit [Flavobacteriales bacterium]|nr:HlyD family efflux transporter periplasmic adaptor subunit [Bacteroidota bacterium]MCB9241068.1 HlyD family efflux transporter periplasmic adaptor subunit [Flavobacteriales bacterium]
MLNISKNRIEGKVDRSRYQSFGMLKTHRFVKVLARMFGLSFLVFMVIMFIPWTQNIRNKGEVIALQPDQRPQSINSIIAGRIEQWYVQEGNRVNKGDTILTISEIKDEYFDPQLLSRTQDQIESKELAVEAYMDKIKSLDRQITALLKVRDLKMAQAENYIRQAHLKIQSDSTEYEASIVNHEIAKKQFERMEKLQEDGLKSLTDLENRRMKMQEAYAKMIGAETKLLASRNQLLNSEVELNNLGNEYAEKLSKIESDKYNAMSAMYDAEAVVTKMQNQYMNYSVRLGYYVITAPQDGFITKAVKTGIGETVKEGEPLVTIMPARFDLAVAMYVKPMDLPLVNLDQPVQFMFDGWPSVAFSGWPDLSYGTYTGRVVAIDNFISSNNTYRVLVAPDTSARAWPDKLRVGSGAVGMALLKDVPIWYELWRKLNGFPPDFYHSGEASDRKQSAAK